MAAFHLIIYGRFWVITEGVAPINPNILESDLCSGFRRALGLTSTVMDFDAQLRHLTG